MARAKRKKRRSTKPKMRAGTCRKVKGNPKIEVCKDKRTGKVRFERVRTR